MSFLDIKHAFTNTRQRIYSILKKGVITKFISKATTNQLIYSVNIDGVNINALLSNIYGIATKPNANSVVNLSQINGNSGGLQFTVENPPEITNSIKDGEVLVGNPTAKNSIYFMNNGDIIISTGVLNVKLSNGTILIGNSSGDYLPLVTSALQSVLSTFLEDLTATINSGVTNLSTGDVVFAVPLPTSIDITNALTTTLKGN